MYEKRIVPQVGYLQEVNRDAPSTKHKFSQNEVVGYIIDACFLFRN
jgi:hypothetical protein